MARQSLQERGTQAKGVFIRPISTAERHLNFWTKHLDNPCFVYVIKAAEVSAVKIGVAYEPRKRLATLQTGNPHQLRLIHVLPGGPELERELHKRGSGMRIRGEWFDGTALPALLEFIELLAIQMIEAYDDSGVAPNAHKLTVAPNNKQLWPKIGSMWLDGIPTSHIAAAVDLMPDELEHEMLKMKANGYELHPGSRAVRGDQITSRGAGSMGKRRHVWRTAQP